MFIAFEGIDGSGKTTMSKELAKQIDFKWTKEPTFSSEEADRLNLSGKSTMEREVAFLIDRVKHQWALKGDIVCDRYIWSGLAYAKVFNPKASAFIEALYANSYFIKPDVYVYVDTPITTCIERGRDQSSEQLYMIADSYKDYSKYIERDSKVIYTTGVGGIKETVRDIVEKLKNFGI